MFETSFTKDELILTKQRKNCSVAAGWLGSSLATVILSKEHSQFCSELMLSRKNRKIEVWPVPRGQTHKPLKAKPDSMRKYRLKSRMQVWSKICNQALLEKCINLWSIKISCIKMLVENKHSPQNLFNIAWNADISQHIHKQILTAKLTICS